MAIWPTLVATDADLYIAVNSLQTTLAVALGTGDVTVTLTSATGWPVAGAAVIGNEVIFYTNISGAMLTGCTRGADGTTAASHTVGVPVGAAIVAFHHNGLMAEIEAIETWLNTHLGKSTNVLAAEFEFLDGVTSAIQTQLNAKAADNLVVHLAGSETITGSKNFTAAPSATIEDASTNIPVEVLSLIHNTSGTPANGIGVEFDFYAETSTTPSSRLSTIGSTWTDVVHATRTSDLYFQTRNSGTLATRFHIAGDGAAYHTLSLVVGSVNSKKVLTAIETASSSTTVGSNPVLWIGGGNGSVNTLSEIGFTYGLSGTYSETFAPVTIGYQLSSGSGFTKGDLVFGTRDVTTDTQVTERLRITAAGDVYTANYQDYSGSSTVTGWSSFTTKLIYYKKVGKTVYVSFQLDGTSNSTAITFTLPFATANTVENWTPCRAFNNGSDQAAPGLVQSDKNSSTVNCYKDWASAAWTNSGRKIVIGQFSYQTA